MIEIYLYIIFPVNLNRRLMWSPTLKTIKFRVSDKVALRKIFGPKSEKVEKG